MGQGWVRRVGRRERRVIPDSALVIDKPMEEAVD